ncbi:hypothetical protein D3C84_991370 [compost metagenome]
MPSEEEFVAALDTRARSTGKVPKLEATEEELKKFDPPKDAKAQEPQQPLPPLPPSYPPLESGR